MRDKYKAGRHQVFFMHQKLMMAGHNRNRCLLRIIVPLVQLYTLVAGKRFRCTVHVCATTDSAVRVRDLVASLHAGNLLRAHIH